MPYLLIGLASWIVGSTVNNATEPSPIYTTPQESQHYAGIEKFALYAIGGLIVLHFGKKYIKAI